MSGNRTDWTPPGQYESALEDPQPITDDDDKVGISRGVALPFDLAAFFPRFSAFVAHQALRCAGMNVWP